MIYQGHGVILFRAIGLKVTSDVIRAQRHRAHVPLLKQVIHLHLHILLALFVIQLRLAPFPELSLETLIHVQKKNIHLLDYGYCG